MAAHWIEIAEALRAALQSQLGGSIERRYTAYYKPEDVESGKYLIVGGASELTPRRGVDSLEIGVDVGYQRALPDPDQQYPDPLNNVPFLDACSEKVQAVKDLFAAGDELSGSGPLRDYNFAGATYLRWRNDPLYRPDILIDHRIYTSVIRFEFRIED